MRRADAQLDSKVGSAIERFIRAKLRARGVPAVSGTYGPKGQADCDLVVETDETVFFFELKKKALTRRARAGSDVDLLLDLAGSLFAAQAQAGWHELRLRQQGVLALHGEGGVHRLVRGTREVEKVALGLGEFGLLHDRITLKQILEATLNATFSATDPAYAERFEKINKALTQIQQQYAEQHAGAAEVRQPFFNCWFVSVPQLLVLLDTVTDAASFRRAFWDQRHIVTGTSDLYFEIAHMRRLRAAVAADDTS